MITRLTDLMKRPSYYDRFESGLDGHRYYQLDEISRTYNNLWGALTDTHMKKIFPHETKFVKYIITGSFFTGTRCNTEYNCCAWERFVNSPYYGGLKFIDSGWETLGQFFNNADLKWEFTIWNGSPAVMVQQSECCGCCDIECASYTTSESLIPKPIRDLGAVHECLNKNTLNDIAEALNDNMNVKGNQWFVSGNTIAGHVGNTFCILEMKYDGLDKIDNEELYSKLAAEDLKDIYLVRTNKGFKVWSDDPAWLKLLKKDKFNIINVKRFDDLTIDEWITEIENIINVYA